MLKMFLDHVTCFYVVHMGGMVCLRISPSFDKEWLIAEVDWEVIRSMCVPRLLGLLVSSVVHGFWAKHFPSDKESHIHTDFFILKMFLDKACCYS